MRDPSVKSYGPAFVIGEPYVSIPLLWFWGRRRCSRGESSVLKRVIMYTGFLARLIRKSLTYRC
ncbi:hypothetical protein BDN70DRAFT_884857 [Pholiota conissans]|uniref:Uncharacterized protein n=1 Tax=Pholiota conissans TaxID=109636 RepID=A0A9P5YV19_9AGAR|nr:hypothetical protein BDN70DRAFT_884857 [Pholiota conissans]